jgi:cation diffusion facilitator family transporter
MSEGCGCAEVEARTAEERRILTIALVLNATMFIVGIVAGLLGHSSSLLADALDMLADAAAYAIGLAAIGRHELFKANASIITGALLLLLGLGVLGDAGRRSFEGSQPASLVMIGTASLSLFVNVTVLRLLGRFREGEIHLRATWVITRVDVIANAAVIIAGLAVLLTHYRWLDLIIGAAIGLYVCKEATEILARGFRARKV